MIEIELISKEGRTDKFPFDHALAILNLRTGNWKINDPAYEFVDGKIRRKADTEADSGEAEPAKKQQQGQERTAAKKKRTGSGN